MARPPFALAALASLMGAAGVGLAAAAAHGRGADGLARIAALFLILHAAALLGLAALAVQFAGGRLRRALLACSFGLGCAAILFSADLAARALAGGRLFPMAAPIGGTGMILFWLALAAIFVFRAIGD
ncbi:MAG TPA: DUF423 domain-containing protein [Roseiarcus sp.]|nr:DUF423 domain-containing protein [Roseiarcus sp.]